MSSPTQNEQRVTAEEAFKAVDVLAASAAGEAPDTPYQEKDAAQETLLRYINETEHNRAATDRQIRRMQMTFLHGLSHAEAAIESDFLTDHEIQQAGVICELKDEIARLTKGEPNHIALKRDMIAVEDAAVLKALDKACESSPEELAEVPESRFASSLRRDFVALEDAAVKKVVDDVLSKTLSKWKDSAPSKFDVPVRYRHIVGYPNSFVVAIAQPRSRDGDWIVATLPAGVRPDLWDAEWVSAELAEIALDAALVDAGYVLLPEDA